MQPQNSRIREPSPLRKPALPRQIAYIIGNEGCERFSFYGMKNILTFFMIQYMLLREPVAKANYHLFVSAVYFFPLLGGWLADRWLGKYRTIFWLSIVYCIGQFALAFTPKAFYVGLGLIALGSGGIKPCVSALVGDQFDDSNKVRAKDVFALFYWIINFGSFFASALIPKTLEWWGPKVAFGIPGVLMAASTAILWAGRRLYVDVPPQRAGHKLSPESRRAIWRIAAVFATIPAFWALFDQKGSTWIVQATHMDRHVLGMTLAPSQLMALNPLLVMLMIPFNSFVLYPALERRGVRITALRRMGAGMFVAGLSFVAVGALEVVMEGGTTLSVLWQSLPYLLLTFGEVLVSTTGLEFAYSQAPLEAKGTIMAFWNLTVTLGNLLTALVARLDFVQGSRQYFFFAGLIFATTVVFALVARGYQVQDRFQGQ